MKYLATLLLIICGLPLCLARGAEPPEQLHATTDRAVYVAGESLWFSVFTTDSDYQRLGVSGIAYVELLSAEGKSLIQKYVELQKGRGGGSLYLPLDLPSARYQLFIYTALSEKSPSYYRQTISVINPFIPLKSGDIERRHDSLSRQNTDSVRPKLSSSDPSLISPDKSRYQTGSPVKLSFREVLRGSYSISVYRVDALEKYALAGDSVPHYLSPAGGLPEWEGPIVEIQLEPAREGHKAILYHRSRNFHLGYAQSDDSGKLRFVLSQPQAGGEYHLQLQNADDEVRLAYLSPFRARMNSYEAPLQFQLSDTAALRERSLAMQLQNVYGTRAGRDSVNIAPFYGEPDRRYLLDDYTRFPTMAEVLGEYVPEVQLRTRSDGAQIRINDVGSGYFFPGEPLLLHDGYPIKSAQEFLEIDPLSIKSLEIVNHRYIWGKHYVDGILHARSYAADISTGEVSADFSFYFPEAAAPQMPVLPDYRKQKAENIPDARYLLYWHPVLDPQQNKEILFYTGDLGGTYKVVLRGFNENGEWVEFETSLTVEDQ